MRYQPSRRPTGLPTAEDQTAAKTALTNAETALAKLLADHRSPRPEQRADPPRHEKITACERALEAARPNAKARAKLPANEIDPAATRAILHINRRCLQLVLRLLAANAEHYLARHLNAYLDDDDEYRAITRETISAGSAEPSPTRPRASP